MANNRRAGNGEGSSSGAGSASRTLVDVMREPSTSTPDIVVLDRTYDDRKRREVLDPREDLWLSSADGRYNSPIVPLRVGQAPNLEIFHVHKDVLTSAEYFRKALCGDFSEAGAQSMDLPEEDPAIFHFLVAFLYQQAFVPIQPIASVLTSEAERGKGRDLGMQGADSDSEASSSDSSIGSDNSARSRRRAQRRQRRQERHWERLDQKHPGSHRPGCRCPRCISNLGPPCWNCGVSRSRPLPPPAMPPGFPTVVVQGPRRTRRPRNRHHGMLTPPGGTGPAVNAANGPNGNVSGDNSAMSNDRIQGEDMRTWLLTYELSLDVYICANKFLMDDFKSVIMRHCVDMLETAGSDAAQNEVLRLCYKLYAGVPESDQLLKMIFARVGFLQPLLWQRAPQETSEFLISNPEVAALILRETATRREEDYGGKNLPSMDRPSPHAFPPFPPNPPLHPHMPRAPNWP